MKLLIVTPHFLPENFKVNDIAFEMKRRGHEVTVMTAIPDYPEGHFPKGYGVFRRRREVIDGVKVHRSLIVPRHSGSAPWLALNYLSYTLFATLQALRRGLADRYDAVIVHETSPVLVGIPAVIVKKMQRIPLHFWVLDLWPESLSAAGGINNRRLLAPFEALTRWIYRNCDTLMIGSRGFEKSICCKGDFRSKIEFFPNWVEDSLETPTEPTAEIPQLPEGFNVVCAGNMGDAQDLPHVMEAALLLKDDGVNFNFVGDGRKREFVEAYCRDHGLTNVYCHGRYPLASMPSFFRQADVLFFALKDTPIFELTVPSRLQAYMSAGKPVVAMINGEGAATITEADCGWSVPAESPQRLAELLRRLARTDAAELETKGANGKAYARRHYTLKGCMDHLEQIIDRQS